MILRVANKLSSLEVNSGNFCHEEFQSSFLNDLGSETISVST